MFQVSVESVKEESVPCGSDRVIDRRMYILGEADLLP